ncbi:hypothetical protein [Methylobacterium sp. ARG-1]|uniref:hypothetical protein n=1 Tax=Methylobacterium sp. ARG-1 TaxID=1692501 RepID=UPI001187590C|nr:hypothetical protein [Methylobacterium sp. ARG-1]
MLAELSGLAAAERRVYSIVENRVLRSHRAIRKGFTKAVRIKSRLWIRDGYAILLIDDEKGIADATKRNRNFGSLFPRLLEPASNLPMFHVKEGVRKTSIGHLTLDVRNGVIFRLEEDAGALLFNVRVQTPDTSYGIDGTLIVVKFGKFYFQDNIDDAIDEIVAFQAESLAKNAA